MTRKLQEYSKLVDEDNNINVRSHQNFFFGGGSTREGGEQGCISAYHKIEGNSQKNSLTKRMRGTIMHYHINVPVKF